MKHFFNMDNRFFTLMSRIGDLLILNLLFIIFSLPIITLGASFTALYSVTLKMTTNDETYMFKGFLKAFKDNFSSATKVWLIFIILGSILGLDFYILTLFPNIKIAVILRVVFTGLALIIFLMISYSFPLIAKFHNTTGNYIKNSFFMALCHLPKTLSIFLVNSIPLICFLVGSYVLALGTVSYLFIGFSLGAYINSFLLSKVFSNYITDNTFTH